MTGAILIDVTFENAQLWGADFKNATIKKSYFHGANFENANLYNTNFKKSNLNGAINIEKSKNIESAKGLH